MLEAVGRAVGGLLAPLAFEGSLIRGARLFHPDGDVYRAEVRPVALEGAAGDLGDRLTGRALVRVSGALWRAGDSPSRPDILGVAVRFRRSQAVSPALEEADQDLLFASFRTLWQFPFGPLLTNARDFLANAYHAVLPFEVTGIGRVKWRLTPRPVLTSGKDRRERLADAVARSAATFRLEVRELDKDAPWREVADIELTERVNVDQDALRFNPFHAGRGIEPVGFFQMVRAAVYAASQAGRAVAKGRAFGGER
jgi:hypothetical protein